MAEQSDGTIKIDTGLDTSGFEKGSEEMEKATDSLKDKVEGMGDKLRDMLSGFGPLKSVFDSIRDGASALRDAVLGLFAAMQGDQPLDALRERFGALADMLKEAWGEAQDAMKGSADESEEAADEYGSAADKLTEAEERLAEAKQKLDDLKGQQEEMLGEDGEAPDSQEWDDLTEAVAAAEEELDQAQAAFDEADYAAASEQLDEAKQRLDDLLDQQESMMNGEGEEPDSDAWDDLADEITDTKEEIAGLEDELERLCRAGDEAAEAVGGVGESADGAKSGFSGYSTAGEAVIGIFRNLKIHTKAAFAGVVGNIKNAGVSIVGTVKSWAPYFGKGLFTGFTKGISAVGKGIRSLFTRNRQASSSTNGLVKSLTSLKTMLVSRIKNAFISQISDSFTDSVKALAKYDSAFDASLSNMKNRSSEIGANLAVTFGSIVTAIEPIITTVLGAMSNAIAKLNTLIASIKGQNSVTVAQKQTTSYAASLDNSASSAKKATSAQKKLNAALGAYDEIHKLDSSDSSDDSTSDAGTFTSLPVASEMQSIPSTLQEAAQKIKDAIAAQDWGGVGEGIGQGLSEIIKRIDAFIVVYGEKVTGAAKALAEGLNGLTKYLDFAKIGRLMADGVNLVFATVDAFITTYEWGLLGTKFAAGINGIVDRFDWRLAGKTVADGINGIVTLITTTLQKTDWGALGSSFMEGVNSLFANVDWHGIGEGVAAGFNAVTDLLYGAVTTADWEGWAEDLAESVNGFIENADFGKAGETLGEAIKGIISSIGTFLEKVEWDKLGEKLAEFVKGVDWAGVAETLWDAFTAAVKAAVHLLWSFFTTLTEDISAELEKRFESMNTGSIGGDIILGLLDGMKDALLGIGRWLKEHVLDPIVKGIKDVFGIHSPSKEMQPLGDSITAGLLEGISNAWSGITGFFSEKLDSIGSTLSEKWESFKTSASTAWEGIKGAITGKFSGLKNDLGDTDMERAGKDAMNSFAGGVYTNMDLLKQTAKTKFEGLKTKLGKVDFGSVGKGIVSGLQSGMTNAWSGLTTKVSGLCDGLVGGVKDFFGIHSPSKVFAEIGSNLGAGLEEGVAGQKSNILRTTGNLAAAITDEMQYGLSAAKLSSTAGIESAVNLETDALIGGLDVLIRKLADVAEAFRGVFMPAPAPALGGIIPMRARVADISIATNEGHENAEIKRMLGQLIELMTEQAGNDRRVQVTVPVQIDRRQLGKAVAEFGLSNSRMTNGGTR